MFIVTGDCRSSDHIRCLESKDTSPQNDIKHEMKATSIEMSKENSRNCDITKGRDFNYSSWVYFSQAWFSSLSRESMTQQLFSEKASFLLKSHMIDFCHFQLKSIKRNTHNTFSKGKGVQ